jgi:ATP-dependent protease Clp ATPase subunit
MAVKKDGEQKCSFCGRKKHEVQLLITGNEGQICDQCIAQAQHILEEEWQQKGKKNSFAFLSLKKHWLLKNRILIYKNSQRSIRV